MQKVIMQAACYIAVILLGYLLKEAGVFQQSDFYVISKLTMNVTLPATVICNLAGKELDFTLLLIPLLGVGMGIFYCLVGMVISMGKDKKQRAFDVQNITAYNVGNFSLPFAQGFLGPLGLLTVSLFDIGNSVMGLGGGYSIAAAVQDGKKFSFRQIFSSLTHSIPFMTNIIMLTLAIARIRLPDFALDLAGLIAKANPFIAMFMIGVGFHLTGNRSQASTLVRILGTRYCIAIATALICYFLLPFPMECRQALVLLMLSPVSSVNPVFTGKLKGDVGLSSALNSISILISLVLMIGATLLIL